MGFLSTILAVILMPLGTQDTSDWDSTWGRLAQLKAQNSADQAPQALFQELVGLEQSAPAGIRRSILGAHLQAWGGTPKRLDPAAVSLDGLSGHEIWLLVEVLPHSSQRAGAVLKGLGQAQDLSNQQRDLAWSTAVAEAKALRLEAGARPIQENLHARYALGWTASDLSLTLMRLGDIDALNRVMQQTIASETAAGRSTADLWSQWGLALLGSGNEQRARDYLGRALVRGSQNAALIIGRLDLQQGRLESARSSFRPSLLTQRPSAWALRGWGAALLSDAHINPNGSRSSGTQEQL